MYKASLDFEVKTLAEAEEFPRLVPQKAVGDVHDAHRRSPRPSAVRGELAQVKIPGRELAAAACQFTFPEGERPGRLFPPTLSGSLSPRLENPRQGRTQWADVRR